jgi:hypothetical protein
MAEQTKEEVANEILDEFGRGHGLRRKAEQSFQLTPEQKVSLVHEMIAHDEIMEQLFDAFEVLHCQPSSQ